LHKHNCPKRKAHEQQAQSSTSSERKAGKCARIKALLKMLRPDASRVDKQLMVAIGMKKGKK